MRNALRFCALFGAACATQAAVPLQPVMVTVAPTRPECALMLHARTDVPTLSFAVMEAASADAQSARATISAHQPIDSTDPNALYDVAAAHGDLYRSDHQTDALQESIRTWAMLIQDFPNDPRMDEILYQLAWGLGELQQHDRARQVYHRLIQGFPRSPRVVASYVNFGEYFLLEGDVVAASRFFERAATTDGIKREAAAYLSYVQIWTARLLSGSGSDVRQPLNEIRSAMRELNTPSASRLVAAIESEWCPR